MTLRKVNHTPTTPQSIEMVRGSGTVIATVWYTGDAVVNATLSPAEIKQLQTISENWRLIYESL